MNDKALRGYDAVGEVEVSPLAEVFENGWQSWSPSGWYQASESGPMPRSAAGCIMGYRPAAPRWQGAFQSEGVMAVEQEGQTVVLASRVPHEPVTFRAWREGHRLRIVANGEVSVRVGARPAPLMLAEWAGEVAAAVGCGRLRSLPAGWCSWYCYERLVTEELVLRQVRLASELRLPIEVFLVDEGYEVALGDWLIERDGFGELARLARTVRAEGKVPGLWLAPFVVAAESGIARAHPEWLLVGVDAGHVWGSDLLVVDSWNDEAVAHVVEVFVRLVEMGFGLFKLDFLYAGLRGGGSRSVTALEDVDGYRRLLSSIRKAIGPEPYLLGCGAPLFASIGLFDSMRVSCDVGVHWGEPAGYLDGRPTEVWYPSGVRAVRSGAARAFAHGVWWVNDPDCLIARPEMEQRECWAKYLEASGGMRFSGDALEDLDPWGLDTARLLLRGVSPAPLSDSALVAVDQLGRELRPRA